MYFRQTEESDEKNSQRIHDGDGLIKRRNLFGPFTKAAGGVTIEGKNILVEKDEALMVPAGVDHGIRNSGNGPLEMMVFWGISS